MDFHEVSIESDWSCLTQAITLRQLRQMAPTCVTCICLSSTVHLAYASYG